MTKFPSFGILLISFTSTCTTNKIDPWAVITKTGGDALYPEKFNVPLLSVSYPNVGYGSWRSVNGFHFHDILGYKTTKNIQECLMLCQAHPPCRAMNYVAPLSRCVLLGSGVDGPAALRSLWNNPNAQSVHIVFTSGSKSKVPTYQPRDPQLKAPFGKSAIAPNIYSLKRQRIIGGTEAVRNSYPFIVRLASCTSAATCSVCGGTLLPPDADNKSSKKSSDLVLTAAHCVVLSNDATKPSQMYVKLANHVDDVVERHEILGLVRRIVVHKGFNSKSLENDLAVIQLQNPVEFTKFVNAIRLPSKDYPTSENTCVAIGWGRVSNNSTQSVTLQQTIMPAISYSKCNEQWRGLNIEKTGRICAFSSSNSAICQGDSGGPLFCRESIDKSDLFTLYGVSSLVDARSCTLKPGVFVRTFAYMKWITQVAQNVNRMPDQQHIRF